MTLTRDDHHSWCHARDIAEQVDAMSGYIHPMAMIRLDNSIERIDILLMLVAALLVTYWLLSDGCAINTILSTHAVVVGPFILAF